jgi:CDP-diacylglycerol--glycerol-3-phosphate 3-phosphatidyltransferase
MTTNTNLYSIPNLLTLLRFILVPLVVVAFFLPVEWSNLAAGWLFLAASLTDLLDGYIARALKQETELGAFLDPIADKIMIIAVLILLTQVHSNAIFAICAIIIIGREVGVSSLREWISSKNQGTSMPVSVMGKIKTFAQMFSLTLLLANASEGSIYGFWGVIGLLLFYLATILTVISMVQYFQNASKAGIFSEKEPTEEAKNIPVDTIEENKS